MEFKDRLRELRKRQHYTGRDVAMLLGVPLSTYVSYENRGSQPPFEALCRIADILGCSVDYLVGHKEGGYEAVVAAGYRIRLVSITDEEKHFIIYNPAYGDEHTASERYMLSEQKLTQVCATIESIRRAASSQGVVRCFLADAVLGSDNNED